MPQSPAGAPAVVSLAPSNADAAPSTPLQHTATHGAPLGVSVEVEVVDERLRKGSEKVDNHQQVTEVGQDKEDEREKMAQGDPMELTGLGRSKGGAEDYGVDVQCEVGEVKNDVVVEIQGETSNSKVAARVDEHVADIKRAELDAHLDKMEAEEKRLAIEEEKEMVRVEEHRRVLESERARIAAERLRLKMGQKLEQGGDKSDVGTSDEGIASDGDGTEGEGKRGKVCEVADGLGKVYGEDKPYRAGGFFKRKKATAETKYCSEQTVGGCKRNLGKFDSERNRNYSIAICWMAYTPDADPIAYGMDKEDVQAWSAHLNLAKQLPTRVWSVLNELHISRIEK
ncbi:unnamed protein product [Closterium sp. NIES-65]|nr:unnamed protein product [Closterium sp. NIES-65]